MEKPLLDQINIVSPDPDASIAFYRRLGVDLPEAGVWRTASGVHHANAMRPSSGERARLEIDSTAFAQVWNRGWNGRDDPQGRVVIGFRVATREVVDELFRDMTNAGYRGLQEPYDALWGARYAMIEDPDGVAVGLMSPVSPDKKSPPPDL